MATVNASEIAWIGIYPPIGIARLGNAQGQDDYTLAPEVIGGTPDARGGFQTAAGEIKRQGVRFHVYARLKSGKTIELVHGPDLKISWRVEVANLKAGWYQFNQAMDLPAQFVVPAARRNEDYGRRRRELDIRPAMRRISGPNLSGPEFRFDDGQILNVFVTLGELRTDDAGRLIFLGGFGKSAPFYTGMRPVTFANNDRWYDDTCDGPVRARVTVGTTEFEADPGYVVVTPPNFAPGLNGLVTMDDTVREAFMAAGWLARPDTTSFSHDIWPIFDRLTALQWINHGFLVAHGVGSPLDARAASVILRLADAGPGNKSWRQQVFALFRPVSPGPGSQRQIPYIYGDLFGEARDVDLTFLSVTPTMFAHLDRWAAGSFVSDWQGPPALPDFAALSADAQVSQLMRAGLTECLGGPFHPGIELTWPMRRPELWALHHAAQRDDRLLYRLNLVPEGEAVRQDFGSQLTRETCLGPAGPIMAAGPGALTRWLGLPWQTDEASCNSSADYSPSTYLSFPSFWGARVPDQVLSFAAFERARADVTDPFDDPKLQRLKHALLREDWLRDVRGRTYYERIDNMVQLWATLGMVEPRSTPQALRDVGFPETVHVETGRDRANAGSDEKIALITRIESLRERTAEPTPSAAGLEAPREPPMPPRHQFRQGEV